MNTRRLHGVLPSMLLLGLLLAAVPRTALAACSQGVGGIKVTVTNAGGYAVQNASVKFSFQDPNNPGNFFSTSKTSDASGEACITAGPGAGTVGSATAAFGVTAADLVGDIDVLVTATGFLNSCSGTTNLPGSDVCMTDRTNVSFDPSQANTLVSDQFTPALKIRAQRASNSSEVSFGDFANRIAGVTFNTAMGPTDLNQRVYGVGNDLFVAPNTLGAATITLHYKGFNQRTSVATYNPSGTTAQVSMSFTVAAGDQLLENFRVSIAAADLADELGNTVTGALTVFGTGNLAVYDPATGSAAAALITPVSDANFAYVEAYDTGGGTPQLRANIPNYVNNDVTVDDTPTTGQVTVNYDQAAGACVAATNDACGFKFPLKVIMADELGNNLTVAGMAQAQFNATNATQNDGANVAYWAVEATGALSIQRDGYADIATTHTPNLNAVTTADTQQMVLTLGAGALLATAPTGAGQTFKGLQFSKKVTFADELAGALTPTAATAGASNVACTLSASAAYCPVVLADDNAGENVVSTTDGYDGDSGSTAGAANRTAHTDAQTVVSRTAIQFSKKITFANELAGVITPSAVTAGGTNVACTMNGATAYCAVPLAQDDAGENLVVTIDGYDSNSGTTGGAANRAAQTDAQTVLTYTNVLFSKKITFTREQDAGALTPTAVTAGSGNVTCTINAGTAYCPVPVAGDDAGENLVATIDGYDGDSGTTGGAANRAATTDAQTVLTVTNVMFSKKITFTREVDSAPVAPTAVTAGVGNTACPVIAANVAYCPVPLAGDDANENVTPTIAGYDSDSGTAGGAANRAAQTDAQTAVTMTGVQFAKKVTFANELGTAISPSAVTAGASNVNCLLNAGAAYCPVVIADDTTENLVITMDGYDSDSGTTNGSTNRAANTDAQTVLSYSNVAFAKKITFANELAGAITPSAVTAGASNTACTMNGATAYCAVPMADDNAGENIVATLDGFDSDSGTTGGAANRTANADAQTVLTYTNVLFSKKITFTREVDAGALTPTAATAGSGNVTCTINAGTAYCPVPLAGDDAAENVVATIDGYDGDSGTIGGAANRAANTDAQTVLTSTNVQFSKKVTGITSEAGTAIAIAAATLSAGTSLVNCIKDGGNTAFYCPVALADDDAGENMQVTLDGYVKAAVTATTATNRAAATDAQTSLALTAVKTSKKITLTREGAGLAYSGATVTAGASNTACTETPASSGVYYCPVPLADDTAENVLQAKAGYITNSGTLTGATNRAANTDAQTALTQANVRYSLKATMATSLGVPITVSTANFPTFTYGGVTYTEAVGNVAYFAPAAAGTAALVIDSVLGSNPNTAFANPGVTTGVTTQTTIELGGPNDPPYTAVLTPTATAEGAAVQAKGFTTNVTVDVCSAAATADGTSACAAGTGPVNNLTSVNFFPKIGATYSAPTAFATSSTPGRYLLTITTSATVLDIVNLQVDNDAPVDYLNKTGLTLTFTSGLANVSASVDIAGDYLCFSTSAGGACSATASISADNDTTLHVVAKNNDGNTITTGVDAARSVTVTLTGGPTGELASTTGVVAVGGVAQNPASSATLTLAAGTGNITFRGRTIASGTTKYVITATTVAPVVFPQNMPANNPGHQSMSVDVTPGAGNKITLTSPVTTATAGSNIVISASVTDAYSNLVTTGGPYAVTLAATGGTAQYTTNPVNTAAGIASTNATSLSIGSLAFTATANPALAGGSNTLTLSFTPGNVASVSITATAAFATDANGTVSLVLRDTNGNILTTDNATTVTVTASNGSSVSLPDFAAATVGQIVGDSTNASPTNTTRTKTVQVAGGQATLTLQSRVAGAVTLGATVGAVTGAGSATANPAAFTKVLTLLAGETQVPGSATGKSGTPTASIETGQSFTLTIKAADAYFNTITTETSNVTVSSTEDTNAAYAPGATQAFVAGSATANVTPGKAGADITYVATSGTLTSSVDVDVTVDVDTPANIAGFDAATNTILPNAGAASNGSTQDITTAAGVKPMLRGPDTDPNDPSKKLGGGNGISALVKIYIYDRFGNAAPDVPAVLTPTIVSTGRAGSGLIANGTNIAAIGGGKTDQNGLASFDLSDATNGGVIDLQPMVTIGGQQMRYGNALRVAFNTDNEAPTLAVANISAATGAGAAGFCSVSGTTGTAVNVAAGACLVQGDTVAKGRALVFQVNLTDTAASGNPAGMTASALTVTVQGADIGTQNATVDCPAANTAAKTCTVTIPAALLNTAGANRTVRLSARDAAGNASGVTALEVTVAGGATITNVVNGPNPFSPLTTATKVTFQLGEPATGILEIYSLAGNVVRTIPITAPNAGYHEVVWDGRDGSRHVVANGIYPYRVILRATSGSRVVGKGKIAVIK